MLLKTNFKTKGSNYPTMSDIETHYNIVSMYMVDVKPSFS